jgi:hypothetical protein
MEELVCSAFISLYLFGNVLKEINLYPRENKKNKVRKAKKVRKKRDINQMKITFNVLQRLLRKSLKLKDFKLYIREGTGDACYTAILYGLLWNVAVQLPRLIFADCNTENIKIKIDADYNKTIWKLNFNCIFSLKIANIIFMCIELLKIYLKNRKGGDADVKSSNRRFNDYSHAKY